MTGPRCKSGRPPASTCSKPAAGGKRGALEAFDSLFAQRQLQEPQAVERNPDPSAVGEVVARVVDRGAFHVKGYEGVTAGDHIKQINAMGETLYPYLKARWEPPAAPAASAP